MESLETLISLNRNLGWIILLNAMVALALLVSVRFLSAAISHVNSREQLAIKDNPAFAVSMSGVILGVIIMMTGVMTSEASLDVGLQIAAVSAYGVLGVILMSLSRLLFDRLVMAKFSLNQEVVKGNMAAAIVDFSNVIASALIVRAAMFWVNGYSVEGFFLIIATYVISQILLVLLSMIRMRRFEARTQSPMDGHIANGNTAVAWRFGGFRVGVALAVTAASELIPYAYDVFVLPIILWVIVSTAMIAVFWLLCTVVERVLLADINIKNEVKVEANDAIGLLQAVLYVAIGLLLASLMF